MKVTGISRYQPAKPPKPAEPTPPPGGNIENRKPPREPTPPSKPDNGSKLRPGALLNIVA